MSAGVPSAIHKVSTYHKKMFSHVCQTVWKYEDLKNHSGVSFLEMNIYQFAVTIFVQYNN